MTVTSPTRVRPISAALLSTLPVIVAAVAGSLITAPNIAGWYAGLAKPSFNPPNWIFGPVWSALYLAMAYAFYRVVTTTDVRLRRTAVVAFLVQIALNGAWSFAFFGAHNPMLGLAVVLALWSAVLGTLLLFWRIDRTAGWLLVPYLAWVSFATVLNAAIVRLN
jgi:benzodiazapine receptor